ncbi:hypothetical protein ALQ64_04396 [Pseudomonas cannabina]|uniref:Uncharacterized protein n=1 Tax=Pseudomonas cannabina TaxID=86840 RepID=A0A3M3KDD4_PSECA|nr:hypothetical protein ALQ64_04396 [Pseudomonas cannabina]
MATARGDGNDARDSGRARTGASIGLAACWLSRASIYGPKEALIYSIFRPCNALEALIYLGATAGF